MVHLWWEEERGSSLKYWRAACLSGQEELNVISEGGVEVVVSSRVDRKGILSEFVQASLGGELK